jgi:membrane associated rhomboid family serine protease
MNELKQAYRKANIVERIIYLNVILFFFTFLFKSFMINWFGLPSNLGEFMSKPWTLISYAFIHERFIHVLANLLILYYIGNLFLDFHTRKPFLNFYFLGLLFGGFIFLAYHYVFNIEGAPLGGASAAVTTIVVAIAAKIPRYAIRFRFIGSVELWVLATIWVALSILQLVNPDKGGPIAHLGGAVFGYLYTKQLQKGNDIGKWFENIIDYFTNVLKPKEKDSLKTVHRSGNRRSKSDLNKSKQRKIDDILDKISKSGYESLTQEEKDYLFRAGKK